MSSNYLGIGIYTYSDASRILRISTQKLHKWADGYRYSYKGTIRNKPPLFGRTYPELAEQHFLTFTDLVQLYLVNKFRQERISMQVIRSTADRVAHMLNTDHPFASMKFHTDGKRIIGEIRDASPDGFPRNYLEDLSRAQIVMETVRPFLIDQLDYTSDGIARQFWPFGKNSGIVIDPKRCYGAPILSNCSVPTLPIYQMFVAGDPIDTIADVYKIDSIEVELAIRYEQALAA